MASNNYQPASSYIQPSFAGGELAPSLQGRVDLARYAISLKTCRNFVVQPYGGASNRPGFRFNTACKYKNYATRLIPFSFNTEQTYVIEIGHQYMRFHRDGAPVLDGGEPVEVATSWHRDDIFEIKYVQSADVLTLVHPDYKPRQLKRYSETDWVLDFFDNEFGPLQDQNVDESITIISNGVVDLVELTASEAIFSEAMVGTTIKLQQVSSGEVAAWQNRSAVEQGDLAYVDERTYKATSLSGGVDNTLTGDNTPAHTEGEQWDGPRTTIQGVTETLGVKWAYLHSGFGYVRITEHRDDTHIVGRVIGRLPEEIRTEGTYRWSFAAWDSDRGYPGTASYYQQRLVFANSRAEPQAFWMSETGIFNGFKVSFPIEADDAITFTLASRQVNEIRHLIPLGSLLALTSGAEWMISDNDQGLAPDTVSADVQGYRGASDVTPLLIGSSALYVQARGTVIRDLAYSFELDGYTGDDLTIFSNHLLKDYTIKDWAYAQEPDSVVWLVRSDGALLSMTYQREQQVVAWARHDTVDGEFESVAVIAEGSRDVPYAIVKRQVGGETVRYIEYLDSRRFSHVEDFFCVDSGLTYDGRSSTGALLTIGGGTNWTTDEDLTLTASASSFSPSDVGRRVRVYTGDKFADVDVDAYVSATSVAVSAVRIVPEELRGVQGDRWGFMAKTLTGLDHLEGKTVSILADGNVHAPEVVTGGQVTLDYSAAVVHVGLPIESDIETLPISSSGATVRDSHKAIVGVGIQLEKSRGVFAARSRRDFTSSDLIELKQRDAEDWGEATGLETGLVELGIPTSWDKDGSLFIRQSDPLPLTILSIIPRVVMGGKG
uniref:Tail Nozzle n=1 Tax=Ribes TaxID=3801 RepID=UPI0023BB1B93|nr:Chain A, Tail Nozzle [Ribes]